MAIRVYLFDAYGTLFDVHAAVRRHAEAIGPDSQRLSELWRQKQLEYSWIRTLARRYRDFATLTEDALDFALASVAPWRTDLKPVLLDAYWRLEPYPEVPAVLASLRARGMMTAILSNGTPPMLAAAVSSAGIGGHLDAVLSVDAIGAYKTDPAVYAMALRELGVDAAEVSFQSSNRWDVAGAVAYGLRAVWVNRSGQPDEYADLPPAAVIKSLDGLLDLP